MTDLIKLVGGVERAKEIMKGVSPWTTGYNIVSKTYFGGDIFSVDQEFYIKDLWQAILDHDRADTCVGIGKIDSLYPEFAKVLHDNFLDLITDNCSDIKNHLSPSTEVIER